MTVGYATANPNAQAIAEIVAAQRQTIKIAASAQGYPTSQVFGWANDPTKGPGRLHRRQHDPATG